jgi:Ca2+-binding RTX toxin-like protein
MAVNVGPNVIASNLSNGPLAGVNGDDGLFGKVGNDTLARGNRNDALFGATAATRSTAARQVPTPMSGQNPV